MGFWDWLRFRKRKRERPEPASLHCSFCGRSGVEAKKLIAGPPPFFICDLCVGSLSEMAVRGQAPVATVLDECTFCGKRRRQVQVVLGTEKATICDECLGLCRDILAEERA
jgi:ATP-dependent protease Clp ATPase subunit